MNFISKRTIIIFIIGALVVLGLYYIDNSKQEPVELTKEELQQESEAWRKANEESVKNRNEQLLPAR